MAIEEELDAAAVASNAESPLEGLIIALMAPDVAAEAKKSGENLMAQADETGIAFSLSTNGAQKIEWRPGRAIVQGPASSFEHIVNALTDFAFYEGELRGLESALQSREAQAQLDVSHALRIRFRDRRHWPRIAELIEGFYRMRLSYARLEPHLVTASPGLPREARQLMSRMLDEANVEDRLEAASNRLEACEDLYEGANDRIAEYRWYIGGQWLEIGIIALLIIEAGLLAFDMYLRHWR